MFLFTTTWLEKVLLVRDSFPLKKSPHSLRILTLTPQKWLFWGPGPLLYRFKPFHWRVQGFLGLYKFHKATLLQLGESLLFTRITSTHQWWTSHSGWYHPENQDGTVSCDELLRFLVRNSNQNRGNTRVLPNPPPQEISLKKGLIRWFFGGLVIL